MSNRSRAAVAVLVLCLTGCAIVWAARWQRALLVDFKTFYAAAATASSGLDIYDVQALNQTAKEKGLRGYVFPYLYTPVLAYLATPWQELSPRNAALLLLALNLALLFPVLLLIGADSRAKIARLFPGAAEPGVAFLFAAAALFAVNFHESVDMGQVNILVLLLIVLCLHFVRTGRDAAGGVLLGIAALLKLTPLLLLFWLAARGRYRALYACLLTIPAVAAVTLALGAFPAWGRYFAVLPAMSYGKSIPGLFPAGFFPNFSLAGFFARLFPKQDATVQAATLAVLAGLLALFVWIVRSRSDERDERDERDGRDGKVAEVMLLPFLVLMVIASPLTYVHHVLFVAPGLVLALSFAWVELRGWKRAAAVAALLGAAVAAAAPFPDLYWHWKLSPLEAKLLTSWNLYALVALMLVGLALALKATPVVVAHSREGLEGPALAGQGSLG